MNRLFLAFGPPGGEKSHLASKLESEHGFRRLCVDDAYVDFIRTQCPMLYFDALGRYILPHYHGILQLREYAIAQFRRDFVAEWHSHLRSTVRSLLGPGEDLVVEGYLLDDCRNELEATLRELADVYQIRAENHQYRYQTGLLAIAQVVDLGASKKRA